MISANHLYLLCLLYALNSCSPSTERSQPLADTGEESTSLKIDTIEIIQMEFRPAVLNVQKGDTVVFVNKDIVAHDATEISNKSWTSGTMPVGAIWKFVPTADVDYYCSIHEVMKGKIIVK